MYLYGVYIMLQSRITLMDEIKTFLCGHYHIILLDELLKIYIYFISLFQFLLGVWEGRGSAYLPCTCLIARPFCGIEKVLGRTSPYAEATRAKAQRYLFMVTVFIVLR